MKKILKSKPALIAIAVCVLLLGIGGASGSGNQELKDQLTQATEQLNASSSQNDELSQLIDQLFDLRPKAIEERLKLRNPIYQETAAYGHMGREPQVVSKTFFSRYEGNKTVEVELFTWEKLDYVDKIKAAFGL